MAAWRRALSRSARTARLDIGPRDPSGAEKSDAGQGIEEDAPPDEAPPVEAPTTSGRREFPPNFPKGRTSGWSRVSEAVDRHLRLRRNRQLSQAGRAGAAELADRAQAAW